MNTYVNVSIREGLIRHAQAKDIGFIVHAKASKNIEELFQERSEQKFAPLLNTRWMCLTTSSNLFVYVGSYPELSLSYPGGNLYLDNENEQVNLGFLRLVGLSEGLQFGISAVHSEGFLQNYKEKLQAQLQNAIKALISPRIEPKSEEVLRKRMASRYYDVNIGYDFNIDPF